MKQRERGEYHTNVSAMTAEHGHAVTAIASLFSSLTEDQCQLLCQHLQVSTFRKNEVIYEERRIADSMLILVSGKIKIWKNGVGGHHQILRLVKPMEMFGYRAFFAHEPYLATAIAIEPSVVASVPMLVVKELMHANTAFCQQLMEHLALLLGHSGTRMVNLTQKHIRGRLAEALLLLIDRYGMEEDGVTLCASLSREDIASLSNMTTGNAIRTLSAFAHEGLIEIEGKKIRILEEEELRKISYVG